MEENSKIYFKLREIKTDEFSMFEKNFLENEVITLVTNFSFGITDNFTDFLVVLKYSYEIKEKPIIAIKATFHFNFKKDIWKSFIKNGKITFSKKMVANMVGLSVGTLRGILYAKTESTIFQKYIIPQVNIDKVVKEDVVFLIEE